ncbi:hypothetical protein Adt_23429 [Abeliophyllum distichum]|uniref:Uncharacterized protein n=1 Tax=Abeliophyllum distichum TaxID=126358 RepID=A0ABD1SCH6_9LAMI
MFDELIGEAQERLPNMVVKSLDVHTDLGAQTFNRYLPTSWRAFVNEGKTEDWIEATLVCSIRADAAQLRSISSLKNQKKKMARAMKATLKANEIYEALHSTLAWLRVPSSNFLEDEG